jgi:glyoxylase I family protein
MAAMIEIKGLDHVVLRVRDPARMVDFYCGVLGCTVERKLPGISLIQLRAGAALIDLLMVSEDKPRAPMEQGNMDHFCLQLGSFDETQICNYLAQYGVSVGATVIRYGAEGMGPSIYIHDPEGNVVELKGPAAR